MRQIDYTARPKTCGRYDFVVRQGSDEHLEFDWLEITESGEKPIDLTGCTFQMQIRKTLESPEVVDEMTSENGRISHNAETGRFFVTMPHAQTTAYPTGRLFYDFEIVDGETVSRILMGCIDVSAEVTK